MKIARKIINGLVVATLVSSVTLGANASVLAAPKAKNYAKVTPAQIATVKAAIKVNVKVALDDLVAKGTITEAQANGVILSKAAHAKSLFMKKGLVSTIKAAQKSAVSSAIQQLTSDGTIPASVSKKLSADFKARSNVAIQSKWLTTTQQTALNTAIAANLDANLKAAVAAGKITQAQLDLYNAYIATKMTNAQKHIVKKTVNNAIKSTISSFKVKRKLTQAQCKSKDIVKLTNPDNGTWSYGKHACNDWNWNLNKKGKVVN